MKKSKHSKLFLEEIRKVPIVQVACEKTGVSRNTVYRWKRDDKEFAKDLEEALIDGVNFVNDMSESQLLSLIKEKNFPAVRFWLNKRHPAYKDKMEVINKHELPELTDSQKKTIKQALELSNITKPKHE
jgi:predicted DNA-binding transcriptional regulator AlpA